MNKADLINEVAKVLDTKKDAQAAVDCVLTAIKTSLKKKKDVNLAGFGTFKVVKRKARKGRNPSTGEAIKIKAKNVPKFVPSKTMKDLIK
jgi:DNA-binding protein HU-beta